MARRSKKHRRSHSRGEVATSPRVYTSTPRLRRPTLPQRYLSSRTRALALGPPVFARPTVRSPLIRTVRTDTKPRFQSPNRRPSPDLPNRALARMESWNTLSPWASFEAPRIPDRALTCARRSIRREVLLALGQGSGSGSRGKPKSKERCS